MSIRRILAKKVTLNGSTPIQTPDSCKTVLRQLYETAPEPLTIHWHKKDALRMYREYRDWYAQLEQLANKE